jgi:FMN phosphatase YigB (HAD superfamily)
VALGCISNAVFSGPVLRFELDRHGLGRSLRLVISSADLGIRKPDPGIFAAGVAALGVRSSSVWFVGDSWDADVRGAAAAGLFPVWLCAEARPPQPGIDHGRIASWGELSDLVNASLRGDPASDPPER